MFTRLSAAIGIALSLSPSVALAGPFNVVDYEAKTHLVSDFRSGKLEPKVTVVQYGALRDPFYCMLHAHDFSCEANAEKVRRSMKFFRTVHVPAYDCASKEDVTQCKPENPDLQTSR